MRRATACGWSGWDDGGKSVSGRPLFWPLSIKGTKLSASSVIALLTLQGGKSLLGTIPIHKQKSFVVVHPSASEIDMLQLATYPQIRHVRKTLQLEKW